MINSNPGNKAILLMPETMGYEIKEIKKGSNHGELKSSSLIATSSFYFDFKKNRMS